MNSKLLLFWRTVFRGIGQIMLQENAYTGVLFLGGIFYGSIRMGISALIAVLTATLIAKLFGYDQKDTEKGLYGFSATLVGVALAFYFEANATVWITIVIGAVLATMLQHWMIIRGIPGFTFPFILVTWIILFLFHHFHYATDCAALADILPDKDDLSTSIRGFGEVIFQNSEIAGLIFFVAIFINDPLAALYGLAAALLSAYISIHLAEPTHDIQMGLFSFNSVLCAIAFSGKRPRDGIFVLISVLISLGIDFFLLKMGFTVLTFPFVAASWITIVLKKLLSQ